MYVNALLKLESELELRRVSKYNSVYVEPDRMISNWGIPRKGAKVTRQLSCIHLGADHLTLGGGGGDF